MMKKYLTGLFCLIAATRTFSQDLNFSQFYEQPLLRNPALCGSFDGSLRLQSFFRNQWPSMHIPYRTLGVSAETRYPFYSDDSRYPDNHWIFGGQFTYDEAGSGRLARSQGMLAIGRQTILNADIGNTLTISFLPGFVNSSFDPSRLRWDDEYANGIYTPNTTTQVVDNRSVFFGEMGVGIVYTHPVADDVFFYVGGAIYHLPLFGLPRTTAGFNLNNTGTVVSPRVKYALNGSMELPLGYMFRLNLFGDYMIQGITRYKEADSARLGKFSTAQLGCLFTYNPKDGSTDDEDKTSLSGGLLYRWKDASSVVIKVEHKYLNFGFSYDFYLHGYKTASQLPGGSFEMTLGYRLNNSPYGPTRCRRPRY